MQSIKRFNKGLSILVATTLVLGGTSQTINAATQTKMEVTKIVSNKLGSDVDKEKTIKSSVDNINDTKDKWINVKTLPKIESSAFGKFYEDYNKYRINFPSTTNTEFESYKKYINAVNTTNNITVNGTKYDNNGLVSSKGIYHFGPLGIDINPSSFTEDINVIMVKANGYNDMKIKIKKDGTFISEEEIKSQDIEDINEKKQDNINLPKLEKIEYSKFYSDFMKYRISFISKTDEQWNDVNNYRSSVNKVIVNGITYNSGNEEYENNYSFGMLGLQLNPSAFKEGANIIVIKSHTYDDMTIKFKKDGDKIIVADLESNEDKSSKIEESSDNSKPNKEIKEWRNVMTLPKITQIKYGEIYGRVEYEISFEKNDELNKYVKAADPKKPSTMLTVNGVKYEDDFSFGVNGYHLSYLGGLELNEESFTEGINTIILKVNGYNDMRIKIKKDGTLISQEELLSNIIGEKNIKFNIKEDVVATAGEKIDLMKNVSAYVIDKEKIDISDKIKVESGKLDVNNPKEGIYEVTYLVNYKGVNKTQKRKVNVTKGIVDTDKLTDGVYTIGFKAHRYDIPKNESMLAGFFDEKAKVDVKDGKITLTMLNTLYAYSLLDFCIESNGKFISAKGTYKGETDSQGQYQMQTFEVPISDLTSEHLGCVLVGMMGGVKNDIGKYDEYKKVRFTFDKTCIKGWDGFNKDKEIVNEKAEFNKALIEAGLDIDKDGIVTDEEIGKAKGVVSLPGKKIKDISRLSNLGSDVTELNLSANNISNLPKGIFDRMVNLKKLRLNTNRIVELPTGVFDKLENLEELSFDGNYLLKLPKGVFDKLRNLKILGAAQNQIRELPNDIFNNLNSLEGLYLYDNKIETIPTGIINLKKLSDLSIDNNKIETVPEELSNLNNLEKLRLNNNLIKQIPNKIYESLKKLTMFEIHDNQLTFIPHNIKELLPKVTKFDFRLNKLNKKPNISNLSKEGFYPQKNSLNLQLTAKGGKLTWKQDLSALDLYVWQTYMNNCNSINEYKKNLNGKTAKEYLIENSKDWIIITEIQKKDLSGNYITIDESISENQKDESMGTYNYDDMKAGDEYRIIKSVISSGEFQRRIFSDLATAKATQSGKNNARAELQKNTLYEVSVKVLQEKNDSPSMASNYIQKVNYEIKNGKKYIIISLNRIDWMKNIKATVDGKEITPEITDIIKNKNGEEQGKIKFEVGSLDSKIMLHMNVVPMGNARVAFRLIPDKNTLTLVKEDRNNTNTKQATKKNNKETSNGTQKQIIKKINNHISNAGKDEKNDTIRKETKLPKTGMPVNTEALATLGTIITALGFALRKKK